MVKKYYIKNYIINNKGEIDVNGDVNLCGYYLTELPHYIQFGTVKGGFSCVFNQITTLKGMPREISKHFDRNYNKLTSLDGVPKKIGGAFFCNSNKTQFTEDDVNKVCKEVMYIYV